MSVLDKELIAPQTAAQMVDAYQKACEVIRRCFQEVGEAEQGLNATFGRDYGSWRLVGDTRFSFGNIYWTPDNPDEYVNNLIDQMRKLAWGKIVNVTGIKKLMSLRRIEELEKNLKSGDLPEVTTENIIDFLATISDNASLIQEEIVKSAYQYLRPGLWATLKTQERNRDYGVQKKIILSGVLSYRYSRGMEVNHYRRDAIAEIDKAFHLLDGKGVPNGYITPLVDAINQEPSIGQTDYFAFKKYKNGNLHMTILRDDLLNRFNQICGSAILHKGTNEP